jgi:hypothetical protein
VQGCPGFVGSCYQGENDMLEAFGAKQLLNIWLECVDSQSVY